MGLGGNIAFVALAAGTVACASDSKINADRSAGNLVGALESCGCETDGTPVFVPQAEDASEAFLEGVYGSQAVYEVTVVCRTKLARGCANAVTVPQIAHNESCGMVPDYGSDAKKTFRLTCWD